MYTPTTITDPSPRAQALSQEIAGLIRERRVQDPSLGVPDSLVALELTKMSLLQSSGVAAVRSRVMLVAAALVAAATGIALFLASG